MLAAVKAGNKILSSYGTTIFEVMSRLAREEGAINLGQGFPDGNGPDDVRAEAARALEDRPNQYPPMMGVPELREAVAAHNRRFYDLEVDGATEVMVTSGATEALASSLLGLLDPGDEVVAFEPLYDSYRPILELAGATARIVRLEPPEWKVPQRELEEAFSPRTKLLLLNSPMNPTGKVFSRGELARIAELTVARDAFAVCDEVYEHLVFDGRRHLPLMTFPGMRERTVRIGSAGKTFSITGWKVGYVTAGPDVIRPISRAHQYLTFTTPPNLQRAVAYGLRKERDYFDRLAADMERKRDLLKRGLERIGFRVAACQGTYFLNADYRALGFRGSDEDFCRELTTGAKVAAVPFSAFYAGGGEGGWARFAFCKRDEVLEEAVRRLEAHFSSSAG